MHIHLLQVGLLVLLVIHWQLDLLALLSVAFFEVWAALCVFVVGMHLVIPLPFDHVFLFQEMLLGLELSLKLFVIHGCA